MEANIDNINRVVTLANMVAKRLFPGFTPTTAMAAV
jgi:hypothetical protein